MATRIILKGKDFKQGIAALCLRGRMLRWSGRDDGLQKEIGSSGKDSNLRQTSR
jgi:hypothetical protein